MARRVSKETATTLFSVQKLLSVICDFFESRNSGHLPFSVAVRTDLPEVHGDLNAVVCVILQLFQVLKNEADSAVNMKFEVKSRRVFGQERENIYGVSSGSYVEFILSAASNLGLASSGKSYYANDKGVPIVLRSISEALKKQNGIFLALANEKESAFRFLLPAGPRSNVKHVDQNLRHENRENCTILVADNDPNILGLVESGLKLKGFSVIALRDGGEALEEFERNKDEVALLFADTSLPHVDGASLARNANVLKPNLRVILTGGDGDPQGEDCIKDIEYGAYISKPYPLPDLFSLIDSLLKG